jgi:hypothetical protein
MGGLGGRHGRTLLFMMCRVRDLRLFTICSILLQR